MRLRQRLTVRASCACFTTAAFILSLPPCVARAQSSRAAREAAKAEMQTRQRELWSLESLKRRPRAEKPPRSRASYPEVAEEFKQLQLRNYELAGAALPGVELDYQLIKKESAEVRKRAERLKSHLLLPEAEDDGKPPAEVRTDEEMRAAIGALDALVNSFAWNPTFQQPGVVDAEHSVKASRDLEGILRLSERIRKCAESLAKAAPKKP